MLLLERVNKNIGVILLVLVGSLSWSLTMVKSGLIYSFGMGFWGPNGHDGVWHIALINHLSRGSLEMPIFAGEPIRNYHIGFDLVLAVVHKITSIPAHTLYFQILPPILAVLVGVLTYRFVSVWRKSRTQAFWATFFVYFAGDFGWVVTLFRDGVIGGESLFWAQQAISTLINPPFALSLVLILLGMILLLRLQNRFRIYEVGFTILIFGLLAQIKVYAWLLVMGGLGLVVLFGIIHARKFVLKSNLLVVLLGSFLLGAALLWLTGKSVRQLVVFQPFWFLETMMAVSDRVGWDRFYGAMMNYKTGGILIKLILAYLVAFVIFFVGNMGTRLIGLWGMVKSKAWRNFSEIDIFLLMIALLGIVLPMTILQAGTPWNTIQFFYYSLFVFVIYSGIFVGKLIEEKKLKKWAIIFLILITIPTTVSTLFLHYLPMRPPAKISNEEMEALMFLEKQPDGVVLTYPFDRYKAELAVNNPPRPLYLYESTAYVSAFSKKSVFIEDEVNLDITGFNWRQRRDYAKILFDTLDQAWARQFLDENNIRYLYLALSQTPVFDQRFRLGGEQLGIKNIFENEEIAIYEVKN